jgi:hypothetical protein
MKPLGRLTASEGLPKLGEDFVSDRVVYAVKSLDHVGEKDSGEIDSYIKGHIYFAFLIGWGLNAHDLVAIVQAPITQLNPPNGVRPATRHDNCPTSRARAENDLVFVDVVDLLQQPQVVCFGVSSVVRLYRFDNFLRVIREALDFFEPIWIKVDNGKARLRMCGISVAACAISVATGGRRGEVPNMVWIQK